MKKAHFIGICGVGMNATAMLLREAGWEITGTDTGCYPPISDYLRDKEIAVNSKFSKDNIPKGTDLVVVGASAKVNPDENIEVEAAHELGVPIKTFPEVLGEMANDKETIIVAGSYGKSTTTTIVAWCLEHAGKDPSYFIGALPVGMKSPSHLGKGKSFVLEGDEYPTSGMDKRSKFLHIPTTNVILVSAEHDHVNMFPTLESYLDNFKKLLDRVPDGGKIIACIENPHVKELIEPHKDKVITYGLEKHSGAMWYAENIQPGERSSFDLCRSGEKIISIETSMLGKHNFQNIVGSGALMLERKLLTPEEFASAISDFKGVRRRMEKLTNLSSIPVYEGFGSSYDKVRSAVDAMRMHFPDSRLLVMFEPFSINWRRRTTAHWYESVFEGAFKTFVYKPPHAPDGPEDLSHDEIMEIAGKSQTVEKVSSPEEGLKKLKDEVQEGDALLLLSSGNLDGMIQSIPRLIEETFPKE